MGGQIVGGRVCGKGQGGGARRVGDGGLVKGVGEGWWGRGWGEALIEVLNKTGIITLSLVIGNAHYQTNRPKSQFSGDFPNFRQGIPL